MTRHPAPARVWSVLKALCWLGAAALVFLFALRNRVEVTLDLLLWRPTAPLYLVVAAAFLSGVVLGLVFDALLRWRQRRALRRLNRRLDALQREVERLRRAPFEDGPEA
ncbi:MAG: hypothetical protein KatS3mg121_0047 [Gammaproteobacteria bacterium]|nr:MAG: hypothetical protein KatS3mg121_0047 [Gammaproteobacteria bacterium]